MPCPDLDELELYLSRESNGASRSAIEQHAAWCPECRQRIEEISENLRVVAQVHGALAEAHDSPSFAGIPAAIGPYRILREIGHGGMGTVYEAEQENPRRSVALKIIKADRVSAESLRRFEHEAQILGRLQHPGIAQIFQAGTADTGYGPQPYFAMELIRGQRLKSFVEQQGLGIRQQLELIAVICDAVHHAHQNGVVHRDLKPANILVTETGQPKILDFGVARVTDSDLQVTTLRTDVAQLIGTIPYMSPEQASGDPRELDNRSDVYALGVITYELLSGRLPYELQERMIPDAVRVIREEDPTPLSSINKLFRGDVETIVAKSLEKEKARRYQSAAELGADIRRYLRDQPITARPPSTVYQFRKFARRNKMLIGGVIAVFVVLTGGAAVSTWQAIRATRAERSAGQRLILARQAQAQAEANAIRATQEAAKYEAVTAFLQEMLAAVDPSVTPGGLGVTVREVLDQAAAKIDQGSLNDHPEIEAAVRFTIGSTYRALGAFGPADHHLRRALELRKSLFGERHATVAHTMNKIARVLQESGKHEQAETLFRQTLAIRRGLFGDEHADVATSLNNLGYLLHLRGSFTEAEALHREALAVRSKLFGEEHVDVATSLNNLAVLLYATGDLVEAERLFRRSLDMDRKLRGELHPNVAATMNNLALVLQNREEWNQAESILREVLSMRREMEGEEHAHFATALNNLAVLLRKKGDLETGESFYRQALAIQRRLLGDEHPDTVRTLRNLASLLENKGEIKQAEGLYRQALEIQSRQLGMEHLDTLVTLNNLAVLYLGQERFVEAEPLLAAALQGAKSSLPAGHLYIWVFLNRRGECLTQLQRFADAEVSLLEAYQLAEGQFGAENTRTKRSLSSLAGLYEAWGKPGKVAEWRAKLPAEATSQPAE